MAEERFVPITEDFRVENNTFNIIKGLRNYLPAHAPLETGVTFELGEWAVLGGDGILHAPDTTARENTYPIWDGSTPDVKATGGATYLLRNGFEVKTTRFYEDTYAAGDKLVVKDLGLGEKVLSKGTTGEHYVAVVVIPPVNGVLLVKVVEGAKI